ncbi:biotin/lipoyl-containing protein [Streptomyces sp. NPDC004232]|uniref:biotin/lipoyl-containing protein n=1 Tax=Streptomyces sp. NPDC004232 TaxID=3154454 RepID=UPI0033A96E0C
MTVSVTLPALGGVVAEGTITRWLKQVGATVRADEPLLQISTDGVDTGIPSPASGVLLEIVVDEDETAEVGARPVVIGSPAPTGPATTKPDVPSPPGGGFGRPGTSGHRSHPRLRPCSLFPGRGARGTASAAIGR